MEEMSAFERQIARVVERSTMPPRAVDAMPIMRSAVASGSRRRSVPTLVQAAWIATAVVVAVLLGGVLAGVLLVRQQDDEAPVVGATPSASRFPTDEILARLETETVAPGVLRVVGDVAGRDPSRVTNSIVMEDGSVWVAGSGIYELAATDRHAGFSGYRGWFLDTGPDGTLWAASADAIGDCCEGDQRLKIRSFDGGTWTTLAPNEPDPASEDDPSWPADYIVDFAVHPDGSLWQTPEELGDNEWNSVQHLGPNGWVTESIGSGLPSPEPCIDCGVHGDWRVETTPDGSTWLGTDRHGLMRWDGQTWEVVDPFGDGRPYGVISLASSRDGVLWAEVQSDDSVRWGIAPLGEARYLARLAGEQWDLFDASADLDAARAPDDEYHGPSGIQAVGPDGSVWLTDRDPQAGPFAGQYPVSFDGTAWNRYPEILDDWLADPERDPELNPYEMGQWHISVGPDGTAWANVDVSGGRNSHGGFYVIRAPEVAAVG